MYRTVGYWMKPFSQKAYVRSFANRNQNSDDYLYLEMAATFDASLTALQDLITHFLSKRILGSREWHLNNMLL